MPNCGFCRQPIANPKNREFCNRTCRARWKISQRPTYTCEHCGGKFWQRMNFTNGISRTPRYCCKTCKQVAQLIGEYRYCEVCKVRYYVSCANLKRGFKVKYCSNKCYGIAFRKGEEQVCAYCGKSYYRTPSYRSDAPAQCCSRRCAFLLAGPSSIEARVSDWLREMGQDFEPQYPFEKFWVDFYLPAHRLFVECDGDYWHSLPGGKRRDAIKNNYAKRHGYRVLHLPEHLINQRPERAKELIRQYISG